MPAKAKPPRPPPVKTFPLRWPGMGLIRRQSHERDYSAVDYPTPWAVNCRLEDPIARRLRGGSRRGLTKLMDDPAGTSIADIQPLQISSTTETKEVLIVLVDGTIGVLSDGTLSFPVAALKDESGNYIVTEAGGKIMLSTADAPAAAFLVTGQQHAYAISSSQIAKLDPKTGLVTDLTASAGSLPTGCTLGAVYRDRLALAGCDNGLYLSRQGDFTDWDYGADDQDTGRAMIFQLSGASEVGDLPTALVPCDDGHLLAATSQSLWIIRGDPVAGGGLQNVSRHVGILGNRAWCMTDRQIVFMADDGLYHVSQDGSDLLPLSREKIPEELLGIDPTTTTVILGYDHDTRAVHIYLTTADGGDVHWLYEEEKGLFWPMMVQDDHAPVAVCEYDGQLLLAGTDGYIRYVGGTTDDDTAISSHVLIGPLRIGGQVEFGLLHALYGIIGAGSGDVTWRIIVGDTAETVADNGKTAITAAVAGNDFSQYVAAEGVWSAGRSKAAWPRARGVWAVLWLSASAAWAFEAAVLEVIPAGRWR